jgi:hypothetical protein
MKGVSMIEIRKKIEKYIFIIVGEAFTTGFLLMAAICIIAVSFGTELILICGIISLIPLALCLYCANHMGESIKNLRKQVYELTSTPLEKVRRKEP